jgi:ubiquinone/menaquinone biosynthesis C-methylase UbiE
METVASQIRAKILTDYYSNIYKDYLFNSKKQAKGIGYFEKFLEKMWAVEQEEEVSKVLELGFGQGEHLTYLTYEPKDEYVAVDISPIRDLTYIGALSADFRKKFNFVQSDAQTLPFNDNYFDRTFSTCLLHHVEDPLAVLLEARRVTKPDGEIVFALPTDPGVLNQLVKKFISYPTLARLTTYNPKLFYALEHRNHIGGLLALINFVFQDDKVVSRYGPFRIKSWNFNLVVGIHIRKSFIDPSYFHGEITT